MTSKLRQWELEQLVHCCSVCGAAVQDARSSCDRGHRGAILCAPLRAANILRHEFRVELAAGRLKW